MGGEFLPVSSQEVPWKFSDAQWGDMGDWDLLVKVWGLIMWICFEAARALSSLANTSSVN